MVGMILLRVDVVVVEEEEVLEFCSSQEMLALGDLQ